MKIDQAVYQHLASSLIDVVRRSVAPIGMPDALEALKHTGSDIPADMAVALIWQMLASDQLRFTDSRKLIKGPVETGTLVGMR